MISCSLLPILIRKLHNFGKLLLRHRSVCLSALFVQSPLSFDSNCHWLSTKRFKHLSERYHFAAGRKSEECFLRERCVCVCVYCAGAFMVLAPASFGCYYYVRYQTINIIGYQNYTWTWRQHWLLLFVLRLAFTSTCILFTTVPFLHSKPIFRSVTHDSVTFTNQHFDKNLQHFRTLLNGEKLKCVSVFLFWISHFNFVTLFYLFGFFSHFFTCYRLLLFSVFDFRWLVP